MRVGSSFGILEPHEGKIYDNQAIDFAIIPGVAFDIHGVIGWAEERVTTTGC
jgi:5-formyltetrahydrofolate cyclo-ligase